MNKIFGVYGEIIRFPFRDLRETFYNLDGIEIEVKDGILYVGIDDKNRLEEAKERAYLYLAIWSERQNIKVYVVFNHSWETKTQVQVTTRTVTIQGRAFIITEQMRGSASFTNDAAMFEKAQKYPALKSSLLYYSQEVINDERPLYGIYKALEAIITYLQAAHNLNEKKARKKLADFVGQSLSYVENVIQTSEVKRHHETNTKRKIIDEECRQRVKILIDAFANSLS